MDQPFAQALVTLAILANPAWNFEINFSALVQTLGMILKLDPVRSALLARAIFGNNMKLPDIDEAKLRNRIGFDRGEKYDFFKDWIEQKQEEAPEIELFFQQAFGELLAPLMPSENDLLACRQLINSVVKFRSVADRYYDAGEESLGKTFINLVLKGTLAAETLFHRQADKKYVILATPYAFLFSPHITGVRYQFWADLSSEYWFRGGVKELTNPYLLSGEQEEEQIWDDAAEQKMRREELARILRGLLGKCTEGVYLAQSRLSGKGWEQEGQLAQWLEEISAGGGERA